MCPYVDEHTRERLANKHSRTSGAQNAWQLTYNLQQELLRFIEGRGLSYQTLAECLGALEGAKLDLIERVIKPYEARKCEENGDVWPVRFAPGRPAQSERHITEIELADIMGHPIDRSVVGGHRSLGTSMDRPA